MAANVPTKQEMIDAVLVLARSAGYAVLHRSTPESKQRWPGEPSVMLAREGSIIVVYVTTRGVLTENEQATVDSMGMHADLRHADVLSILQPGDGFLEAVSSWL